jgi:predicted transcriptional regulator
MRYRNRVDIINLILTAANGDGVTKTKIMYRAFVSHDQLKEYLVLLTRSGLLHHDEEMRMFRTTEKGLRFLQTYDHIDQILKEQPI